MDEKKELLARLKKIKEAQLRAFYKREKFDEPTFIEVRLESLEDFIIKELDNLTNKQNDKR